MEKLPLNQKDEVPFSDNLVESDISEVHKGRNKLFEFENNPDKIIRVESFDLLEKRYRGKIDPITLVGLGRGLYEELERDYGFAVPVEYVVGKDSENRKVVYGITDKVEGENLDKSEVSLELTEAVEKLYTSISHYYLDKLHSRDTFYLADINNSNQYVYGKRKGDEKPKIYLVDTDLFMHNAKAALYNIVLWFIRHMGAVEERYQRRFIEARKIVEQILNEPLPSDIADEEKDAVVKTIAEAKDFLDGRFPEDDGIESIVSNQ